MSQTVQNFYVSSPEEASTIADLVKSASAPAEGNTGVIVSKDDDKRLVFGWANIAKDSDGRVVVDRQGDWTTVDELEKAAYHYVLNSRDGGEQHLRTGVATVVESMVFTNEKLSKLGIPEGAVPEGWWVGFKIHDEEVWNGVKKGNYPDFSIHGSGKRMPRKAVGDTTTPELAKGQPTSTDVHQGGSSMPGYPTADQTDELANKKRKKKRKKVMTVADVEETVAKREVGMEEREKLAGKGKALPDGSFPIANVRDLMNAIRAFGRAKDKAAAKTHIMRQAKRLDREDLIPEDWMSDEEE